VTFVIASQLEPALNEAIARHPSRPKVIAAPVDDPWTIATRADALIVRPTPAWRQAPCDPVPDGWPGRLRWVFTSSAGVDFYPNWLLDAPVVSCARGTASEEIADYVIAAIYARTKELSAAAAHSPADWRYTELGQVVGSTIGVIGLGAIGTAVARRATALGARVLAVRRTNISKIGVIGVDVLPTVADVVRKSDHVIIAVPATPATRHLFGRELLAKVKPGAHLINVARGSVVDQDALLDALDAGHLSFATLDVTDPEPLPAGHRLYSHPKVLLTPHISASYTLARGKLLDKILTDITRVAYGQQPVDVVDRLRGY